MLYNLWKAELRHPEYMVIDACLIGVFALQGKLHRSFRAWKSFKLKSLRDKTLRNKASNHHNKTLLGKAVQAWKSYSHLCFKIKVSDLCGSFQGRIFGHPCSRAIPFLMAFSPVPEVVVTPSVIPILPAGT